MSMASLSAEDLRAALARARIPIYVIAARVRMHPVNLSRVLNGHSELKPEFAERIMAAVAAEIEVAASAIVGFESESGGSQSPHI